MTRNHTTDELRKDWEASVNYWDEALNVSDEDKEQIMTATPGDEWKELAPSEKLFEAVKEIAGLGKFLDYGCGHGWGAVSAAKLGCKDVVAVDMAGSAVELTGVYAKAFGVEKDVKTVVIDEKWLEGQPGDSYDAVLCSNVVDVVPLEIAEDILKNLARVLKTGGKAVIGMNFYMSPEEARERGMDVKHDRYMYSNGVLRLSLISDDEWKEILGKYFTVEDLDHFAWPGEKKGGRRLFRLKKD
ncbi:MAG: class I SAM-dependent methyltransferase [Lachnospiraceae bacterium]|nr:class I SAM-dependent methyltransferase [Lachnospiraceae bacterium]